MCHIYRNLWRIDASLGAEQSRYHCRLSNSHTLPMQSLVNAYMNYCKALSCRLRLYIRTLHPPPFARCNGAIDFQTILSQDAQTRVSFNTTQIEKDACIAQESGWMRHCHMCKYWQ